MVSPEKFPDPATDIERGASAEGVAVLAGGCFWGVEAVYKQLDGGSPVTNGGAAWRSESAEPLHHLHRAPEGAEGAQVLRGSAEGRLDADISMKIGLQIPSFSWPGGAGDIGPTLAKIAHTADEGGFDLIGVMDHFFQIGS